MLNLIILLALFVTILIFAVCGIEPTDRIFERKKKKKRRHFK